MNHIVIDVSSGEEDYNSDLFGGILKVSDEKSKSADLFNPMVKDEDDDDDCVILDCDPTAKEETVIDTCGTDEVLVLGQKGEIACRDFPHPRHACAKYPFKSTLHQQFCEMCHCYVCDTRAPCPYWFRGLSLLEHCHANDKDKTWKNQRQRIRTLNMLPRPVSKHASNIVQLKRVSRPQSVPFPQNSSAPVTQFGIQACSTATSVATHPNTYSRPDHRTVQFETFPNNPVSQPHAVQSLPNNRSGSYNGVQSLPNNRSGSYNGVQSLPNQRGCSYNGNPSTQTVPSNPYVWTRTPSSGASHLENGVQNIAQGSQATCYTPPSASQGNSQRIITGSGYMSTMRGPRTKESARKTNQTMYSGGPRTKESVRKTTHHVYSGNLQTNEVPSITPSASQGNAQRIVAGYISNVRGPRTKESARKSTHHMNYGNLQTNKVPSMTPNPPANQHQQQPQSGSYKDRVLSEFEEWLLDDSSSLYPLSGQDNATTDPFDFESFLNE
ncbi:hypothetical protein CARUB_v10004656mg [Capsella rubella]|uniref:RPM1 interacting protein 13 n=1 Tax=Capsella rubella TaxID=81985 RepID=R0GZF0_9BRAS|nr:uncharacterized protein LOC17877502 [Capsella rubella]EOA16498.1 hypothetical protein CARUB_v10004656mg [Capsella rubella]